MRRRKNERGFTLIELLVVLGLIMIIAVRIFGFDRFLQAAGKRDLAVFAREVELIKQGSGAFMLDTHFPPEQITDLWNDPGINGWNGPYVSDRAGSVWLNPWNEPYSVVQTNIAGHLYLALVTRVPADKAKATDEARDSHESPSTGDVLSGTATSGGTANVQSSWPSAGLADVIVRLDVLD